MFAVSFGGDVRFIAVAAPSYLQNRGAINTPDDLQVHSCIRQRLPSGKRYRWAFCRRGAEVTVDVPGNLTLDDNDLLVEEEADGRGIAYVPEHFAQSFLKSRRLVTVVGGWCPPTAGLALYYPRPRPVPSSTRGLNKRPV